MAALALAALTVGLWPTEGGVTIPEEAKKVCEKACALNAMRCHTTCANGEDPERCHRGCWLEQQSCVATCQDPCQSGCEPDPPK